VSYMNLLSYSLIMQQMTVNCAHEKEKRLLYIESKLQRVKVTLIYVPSF